MSEDRIAKLRSLEEEFLDLPPSVRQSDLVEINQLRNELGLPQVDSNLAEIGAIAEKLNEYQSIDAEPVPDHSEARKIFGEFERKFEVLNVHRAYAEKVSKATSSPGMTPVRPLATMGTDGGPLLCDQCKRPIILEGGEDHGVSADIAWQRNAEDRTSWILGGLVVEIETNGTLRVYHGYPGRNSGDCCNIASRKSDEVSSKFDSSKRTGKWRMLLAFIEFEFPMMPLDEQTRLLNDMLDTMFNYDPGFGVNRPPKEAFESLSDSQGA